MIIKDLFAPIYETWFDLFDPAYRLIFSTLYNDGGYIFFGLAFLIIPLVCWLLFYYAWKYPYGKLWHWLLFMLIVIVIVFASTWSIANTEIFASNNQDLIEALNDPDSGYKDYATLLPMKYGMINSLLSLAIGIIYSFIMKQFSKVQIHLPI